MSIGAPAVVVVDGRGGAVVSVARNADPAAVDQVRRRLLREERGLRHIDIAFDPALRASAPDVSVGDVRRIVAAVSGPDGYLIAADGSKYFAGAQLPTGQILKSVDQDQIVFDQDGSITSLKIQGEGDTR